MKTWNVAATARVVPLWALLAVVAGCASPSPHFYTLSATTAPSTTASTLSIAVSPVSVPALVDRPQIVLGTGPNEVRLDEFNRWAGPLADNISRVIQANLSQDLGTPHVWSTFLSGQPTPDFQVTVSVQRFETQPGDASTVEVFWTVRRSAGGAPKIGHSLVREASVGAGVEPMVSAHSRALARISADIAAAIRSM